MLTRAKKQELRERLEHLEAFDDRVGPLAAIVREILEATPTQSEHEDAVAKLAQRTLEELPPA